jgi:hypothetical protein
VSTENNYDFLVFFIDGLEKGKWSGEHNWTEHSFMVLPGRHTFTWRYTKDNSVNGGMDAVWIDYIKLPYHLDEIDELAGLPLDIHPNPTTGQVTITGRDLKAAEVYNSLGQKVAMATGEGDCITLDISNLPSGLYIVSITDGEGANYVKKVVKE